jgi:hypothetical protein
MKNSVQPKYFATYPEGVESVVLAMVDSDDSNAY